jgi:hypothetical protein
MDAVPRSLASEGLQGYTRGQVRGGLTEKADRQDPTEPVLLLGIVEPDGLDDPGGTPLRQGVRWEPCLPEIRPIGKDEVIARQDVDVEPDGLAMPFGRIPVVETGHQRHPLPNLLGDVGIRRAGMGHGHPPAPHPVPLDVLVEVRLGAVADLGVRPAPRADGRRPIPQVAAGVAARRSAHHRRSGGPGARG